MSDKPTTVVFGELYNNQAVRSVGIRCTLLVRTNQSMSFYEPSITIMFTLCRFEIFPFFYAILSQTWWISSKLRNTPIHQSRASSAANQCDRVEPLIHEIPISSSFCFQTNCKTIHHCFFCLFYQRLSCRTNRRHTLKHKTFSRNISPNKSHYSSVHVFYPVSLTFPRLDCWSDI